MPSSREVQERRREGILKILKGEEPVGQQKEIVQKLLEMGIPATQSSVSRDLAELGALRIGDQWRLPDWAAESPFSKVVDYVEEVKPAGPYMTLIKTLPGAGAVVAQAIDESPWDDVVGTVGGINSVLVLTEHAFDQKLLFLRLERYLGADEEEDILEDLSAGEDFAGEAPGDEDFLEGTIDEEDIEP